jgi:hypothetical protein
MDVSPQLLDHSVTPSSISNPYQHNSNNFYIKPKGFAEDRQGFWPK